MGLSTARSPRARGQGGGSAEAGVVPRLVSCLTKNGHRTSHLAPPVCVYIDRHSERQQLNWTVASTERSILALVSRRSPPRYTSTNRARPRRIRGSDVT